MDKKINNSLEKTTFTCEEYIERKENGEFFYYKCGCKAKFSLKLEKGMLINGKTDVLVCKRHFRVWKNKLERFNKKIIYTEV